MANIKSIQLLRNTTQLYASREAALSALTGATVPAAATDGTPVLARYKNESGQIITLVGYYAVSSAISGVGSATTHMTVFDYEGNVADVEELKNRLGDNVTTANTASMQFAALSGNNSSTSAETSVEGAKKYADEKVRARLDELDYNLAKDDNKIVVSLNQTDGKISGVSENISSIKLAGYTEGTDADIAATDTLGEALGKLQAQINAMDKTASAVNGQVVTTISEEDGKVTETKANVKDLQLGGYVRGEQSGAISGTDSINVALSKIENNIAASQSATTVTNTDHSINVTTAATGTTIGVNINSVEKVISLGDDGIYTDIKLSAVTVSEANVKEAFALIASDGATQLGSTIKIYKDSSLLSVALLHADTTATPQVLPEYNKETNTWTDISTQTEANQALCFAYENVSGDTVVAAVPVGAFINEQEFASGITWDSAAGKVKGVVDSTSEAFLTVGANGFKLSGVQDAIDAAVDGLDATVSNSGNSGHVGVEIVEENGKLVSVTVSENDIASANAIEELSAKTITNIKSTNNSIDIATANTSDSTVEVDATTDASKIKMSGFTPDESGFTTISQSSSVTEAFKAVESYIISNEEVISAALNDLEERKAEKTDVSTMYNHLEDEIRELQSGTSEDLANEIAARKAVDGQSGQTYVANADKKYISGATSLNDADILLNDAIENITSNWIEGVQINGVDLTEASNKVNAQFSASTTFSDSANAIVITQDSTTGGLTFALGTLDAGTY